MNVAMIVQRLRPYFSGQGVQVEELCKALARRGVESTILTAVAADVAAPADEAGNGYRIRRLRCDPSRRGVAARESRLWSPLFAARCFTELVRLSPRPDVVHVHAQTDALYAAWLFGRLWRVPVVFEMTLLGTDDPHSMWASPALLSELRFAIYRRSDGYVAISPALADAYRAAGLDPERLRLIPQGVDLERFSPAKDRAHLRAELGLPAEGPVLVFLGSLVERKGIDILLEAWVRVAAAEPRAELLLVGRDRFPESPSAEAFLARRLESLPAEASRRLRRLGVQQAPERFLQAADVFLLPSRREGFGTAIAEAMACGLPAVVSELPGITDFIFARPSREPGERADGLVVPPDDPGKLAEVTLQLLAAPERARKIGAAARERAQAAFGFDGIVESYLAFYAELGRRKRGS